MKPRPETITSVEFLKECFSYDETTGLLTWKRRPFTHFKTARDCNAWNSSYSGKNAGRPRPDNRVDVCVNNLKFRMHRVVMALFYGQWPEGIVDHKDGNASNNRIDNLRVCTFTENQYNSKVSCINKLGVKGVCWSRGRYKAQIRINGKQSLIGCYKTIEEASKAYCDAAKKHHGEFYREGESYEK